MDPIHSIPLIAIGRRRSKAGAAAQSAYRAAVLEDAPALYWSLDETTLQMVDLSGNDRHGDVFGDIVRGEPTLLSGGGKSSYSSSTASDQTRVQRAHEAWMVHSTNWSLECWLKADQMQATQRWACCKAQTIGIYAMADGFGGLAIRGSLNIQGVGSDILVEKAGLALNTAYHVVVTYDGSVIRLYIDGPQVATRNAAGTLVYNTSHNFEAHRRFISEARFAGWVDEVAAYPGVTLSAARIQAHYDAGIGA